MLLHCFCCGRRETDCPGGIWRGPHGGLTRPEGICVYCARAALRAFGDAPLPDSEPVRLPLAGRVT